MKKTFLVFKCCSPEHGIKNTVLGQLVILGQNQSDSI